MTMRKDHRSGALYMEKNSLRMRALPSDGNHVVDALDALGREAHSGAINDTLKPGPTTSVENVDQQKCDLCETSSVDALRGRLRLTRHVAIRV